MLVKNRFFPPNANPDVQYSVKSSKYQLYHWIGYSIVYFGMYNTYIRWEIQVYNESLTATSAKRPLSPVVYP